MKRFVLSVLGLLALTSIATANPNDVVFKGGLTVTSTSGCQNGWDPKNQFFIGTYFVPVAGSSNGSDSTITFHQLDSSEGFTLINGSFTTAYKKVQGTHVYTRAGTYDAYVLVSVQTPAVITTSTKSLTMAGSLKGWSFNSSCIINFHLNAVKDLQP